MKGIAAFGEFGIGEDRNGAIGGVGLVQGYPGFTAFVVAKHGDGEWFRKSIDSEEHEVKRIVGIEIEPHLNIGRIPNMFVRERIDLRFVPRDSDGITEAQDP